ncbi:agmatine deiminase [Acidocella sp.]|uniref:agmatine deiminase n=1 Tax=Acidocella sp. TaxID=50710 RepID=UPI002608EFD6|nr:agmatine deiminase [Acidocella sp.]
MPKREGQEVTPREAGFAMPAEWAPHAGCWMIWPERPDNWRLGAKPAQKAFTEVASAIARFEPVTMLVSRRQYDHARAMLPPGVRVVEMSSDDAWARDVACTFLLGPGGELAGVDWPFTSWGGLYFPWDKDDAIARKILELERARRFRAPLVMEGGALHVDGEGTVLAVEQCVLNENRNRGVTRQEMERMLKDYTGSRHVIWLKEGVPHDETDGHVDNLACFAAPGVVLLSWCDDPADPHYAVSRDAEAALQAARDARGRRLRVEKIPMPAPMFYTAEEADGVDATATGMNREAGARLAASYVNFYIANGAIIAPAFGAETDAPARAVLARLFPGREIVMIPAREILLGGGNIHCITQQQPKSTAPGGP